MAASWKADRRGAGDTVEVCCKSTGSGSGGWDEGEALRSRQIRARFQRRDPQGSVLPGVSSARSGRRGPDGLLEPWARGPRQPLLTWERPGKRRTYPRTLSVENDINLGHEATHERTI